MKVGLAGMRTRAGRRRWVVGLYTLMLGGAVELTVEFWFHGNPIRIVPGAVAMALALPMWFLLARRAMPAIRNNMRERSDDPLIDERQREVRDRAYRQAYHVVSVLALLSFVAGWLFWVWVVMDHFQEMRRHAMSWPWRSSTRWERWC